MHAKLIDGKIIRCTVQEWAAWFEDTSKRVVGRTPIVRRPIDRDRVIEAEVSTVFTGLDANIFGPKPLWFETMIFWGNGETSEHGRWATLAEAQANHELICVEVQVGRIEQPEPRRDDGDEQEDESSIFAPSNEVEKIEVVDPNPLNLQLGRRKIHKG